VALRQVKQYQIYFMKGVGGMNTKKIQREKVNSPLEPYHFTKRIGSTVYSVNVSFKHDAKETIDEKILRLMRNDVQIGKVVGL